MGLNSKTFNYLQKQGKQSLIIKAKLHEVPIKGLNSKKFYTECVALSKACLLKHGAANWPAFKRWSHSENGYKHLAHKFGETKTTVYVC